MTRDIHFSVRSLVEYLYRTGSITNQFHVTNAQLEGTRIHQLIQHTYGPSDEKEVYLSTSIEFQGIHYQIDGRCDGLLHSDHSLIIDEIKSSSRPLVDITQDSYPVHWAQAKWYAYIYCLDNQLEQIIVQLTYVQVKTEEIKQFRELWTFQELSVYIQQCIADIAEYAHLLINIVEQRQNSLQSLTFPYDTYRAGQKKLVGAVYKSVLEGKSLFANAPTGIGKTISTIFPALLGIKEERINKIFYLTAKTITRKVAEDTLSLLVTNGLSIKAVTLTAKEKMCFKQEGLCQSDSCDYADGYFDRINGAIIDILNSEQLLTRDVISQYAHKHRVCPFEFSIDLAYLADIVIGDYNYAFDPRVSLKRLTDEQKRKTVLLVDEAHNLVDRGREMFSASIEKRTYLDLQRQWKERNKALSDCAKAINRYFIQIKKELTDRYSDRQTEKPEALFVLLGNFIAEAEKELVGSTSEEKEALLNAYFSAQSFVRVGQLYDETTYITYRVKERDTVQIKLFCLHPADNLTKMGKKFAAKIYFSATLTPLSYFTDLLGAQKDDYTIGVPSPFLAEQMNVKIIACSTRFNERQQSVAAILKAIHDLTKNRGNYLVFFPSYQYMRMVVDDFLTNQCDLTILIQQQGMDESARESFLSAFQEHSNQTVVGFAVLGGIFSEGIDLVGDCLNGVLIVGVGLPQLNEERNIIRDYYTNLGKNGYDYAYVFPGINKVLQAGGRLIRSETDKGSLVLLDDRFLTTKYQSLLPDWWRRE